MIQIHMFRVNNGRQHRKRFSRKYVCNLKEMADEERKHLRTFIRWHYPKGGKHPGDITIDSTFTEIPDNEFLIHLSRSYTRIPQKYIEMLRQKK